jgi:carbonic anhydrase/acetyltransferase-like protein (isoleucine patch superfamily)
VDGAAGRNAVLVLKESVFGRDTVSVQLGVVAVDAGWRFDAIRFDAGTNDEPLEVVVDPQERVTEVPFPKAFTGEPKLEIGLPQVPVMTLHHWVHILWANQFTGTVELFSTPRWKLILRGIWAVIRAMSLNKWKVLAKFTKVGKGCDIHPTAVVEGCTLGDNVTVGAFCHLQFSTIADGVTIMPGAQIGASVVGENAWISEECVLRFSVLYPGAIASQRILQHSVLGRDAATTAGSGTIDFNFDGPVKVTLDGKLKSTGARFVGAAFGHRSKLGAGITLAAGKSIPNDTVLVADPKTILSHIPTGHAGTPLIASGSRATPVALLRRRAPRVKDKPN